MIEYAQPNKPGHRRGGSVTEGAGSRTARWFAWEVGWVAAGFLFTGGIVVIGGVLLGAASYVSPIGGLLILASLAALLRGLRRDWDLTVLSYLEQAVRLNLPLPPMIRAAELGERPAVRRRLQRLRERVEEGEPIGDSLRAAAPGLPPRIVGLVGAAERSGRLATALHRLVLPRRHRSQDAVATAIFLRWYPLILFVFAGGAALLISTIVMPKFEALMHDFGISPPKTTQWLIEGAQWMAPVIGILAGFALLMYSAKMLAQIFSARSGDPGLLGWPGDFLRWHIPFLRGLMRARAMADACNVIADALEAGRTLDWAIYEAADVPTNLVLQSRLRRWGQAVLSGMPMDVAARQADLPDMVIGMVATADAASDLPQVLRFLARYYESRFSRAIYLLRGAAIPALAIIFGILVLIIARGLFEPMIEMVGHLSPNVRVL